MLTTIGNALAAAFGDEDHREASAMTIFVTLSGIILLGIGTAFWGIVLGSGFFPVKLLERIGAG